MKAKIIVLLALVAVCIAEEAASSDLIILGDSNYLEQLKANPSDVWFVKLYAPWCGHCQRLEPTWNQIATELKGKVKVAKIDCDANSGAGQAFEVQGYPTLVLLADGKLYEYNQGRDAESLKNFALGGYKQSEGKNLPGPLRAEGEAKEETGAKADGSDLIILGDSNYLEQLKANPSDVWFVKLYAPWCGHCQRLEPTWNQIAADLKCQVKVAKIDCDANSGAGQAFEVQGYPTLVLLAGGKLYEYNQGRDAESLKRFALGGYKQSEGKNLPGPLRAEGEAKEETGAKADGSDVVILEDSTYLEQLKANPSDVWFLKLYAPWCGHCQRLEPAWNQIAAELKGKVKVAKVNCDANSVVGQAFEVRGYPTLVLLAGGKLYKYNQARDVESLKKFALGGFEQTEAAAVPEVLKSEVRSEL